MYAFGAAILTSFTFEGVALYLDWYRWVIPGIVDLKGSYIRFDHGLTRINKDAFPSWIAMMFLALYLLWFVIGCETAKKHHLTMRFLTILMAGVVLLVIPSVIQSQFLSH
ncbi:MAG TPA: hypothetical protein VF350_08575 [Candidatus Bathyarchaeia archaeon]